MLLRSIATGIFHLCASTILITLTVLLPTTTSIPYRARNSNSNDSQINKMNSAESSSTIDDHQSQQSIYVKLASEKPQLPPWAEQSTEDNLSRPRRTVQTPHIAESVCDSISSWEEKEISEDMWGNPVQIVRNIQVGGTRMAQYFYETYCHTNSTGSNHCRGIDSNQYNSECETKHIWAYAQVRTLTNETGWTHIKIRGSCNCSLFAKHVRPLSIWEEILQLRR